MENFSFKNECDESSMTYPYSSNESLESATEFPLFEAKLDENDNNFIDTEVVIIGNGPAGLSLSVFLSGWLPYYDINSPHPDARVHARLAQNATQSLLDQDLSWFEEEFAEIINPTVQPVAFLIDMLMRPPTGKSCLRYVQNPAKVVPHIVLGDSDAGGSWNNHDEEMITVSLIGWLDLPAFSLVEWFQGQPLIARVPAGVIREYMKAYAKEMGLMERLRPHTRVAQVIKQCDEQGNEFYEVKGEDKDGEEFTVRCRKVVLASGQNKQKCLGVPGEDEAKNIVYDIATLKKAIQKQPQTSLDSPVVVIGDGISAADAVIQCLKSKQNVIHVMRRSDAQLKSTMLSKLSGTIYPEYAQAYKLMIGKDHNPLYQKITQGTVKDVDANVVSLNTAVGIVKQPFKILIACLGRQADLSMISQAAEFRTDYRCSTDSKMFAVGSVAGDHFIRYLIGGCLQVASTLNVEYKQEQMKEYQRKLEQRQIKKHLKLIKREHSSLTRCWMYRILSQIS